jgi:hypothetical protein
MTTQVQDRRPGAIGTRKPGRHEASTISPTEDMGGSPTTSIPHPQVRHATAQPHPEQVRAALWTLSTAMARAIVAMHRAEQTGRRRRKARVASTNNCIDRSSQDCTLAREECRPGGATHTDPV